MGTPSFVEQPSVPDMVNAQISALIATGVIAQPKKRRKGMKWESKLAYEYVEKFYSTYPRWFRVSVGPVPGGNNDPLYYKLRRWADVIVRMPDHMLIMEVKMLAKPDVVGQLKNYEMLFPQTPMFDKYKDLPLKTKVVCSLIDGATQQFIEQNGIEVEVFRGTNFEDWYQQTIVNKRTP